MKKIVLLFTVVVLVSTSALKAATRDVLAHAAGEWSWFAHVTRVQGVVPTNVVGSNEQTECFVLQNAPGQQWKSVGTMPGRAVALASRLTQLAVLMSDGQWFTLWTDGSATGQPLPAKGHIKAFTDDGNHLWAVGSVSGGMTEANRVIAIEAAATQPTTNPFLSNLPAAATTAPNDLPPARSVPSRIVLFREQNGRWATVTEVPPDAAMTGDEEMSLAVIGGAPLLAIKTDANKVRTLKFTPEAGWVDVGLPESTQPVVNFQTVSDGYKPMLWWTRGNEPGQLIPEGAKTGHDLPWPGKLALDGVPTAVFSGGYICVFGPHAGKVLEQQYKTDGTPVDTATELNVRTDMTDSLLPRWLEVMFLTSMGFSVGASVFRQWSEPVKGPVIRPPVAAPVIPRLASGLLDALPVIAAFFYVAMKTDALNNPDKIPALRAVILLASAFALYLLHTTIVEVLTGRSAGKWVFGLKVVTLQDTPPAKSQLLIRNLLRVIDPLVMIIITPQRQRSADAVAGTMVVPLEPLPEPEDDFEDEE